MSDDVAFLKEQARRCRRLARGIATPDVVATLTQMASDYDARAEEMENRSVLPGREADGEDLSGTSPGCGRREAGT